MPERFDLNRTPLEPGTSLIEASAGTGKTFTIAAIAVRLVVEQGFEISRILVVTFTEAATAELCERIRRRLVEAKDALAAGRSDDGFLQPMVEANGHRLREAIDAVERALAGFDEAPIYTIHGFCQRMLKDHAFESGQLFDTELVTDPSALLREVADDYWRKRFYPAGAVRVNFALKSNLHPEAFLPWLRLALRHPDLKVLSRLGDRDFEMVAETLEETFAKAGDEWRAQEAELRRHFGDGISWGNRPYNSSEQMEEHFANLARCFTGQSTPEALASLAEFSRGALAAGTSKRSKSHRPPQHRFFDLCEELLALEQDFLTALQLEFREFAAGELPRRKNRAKLHTFDDLLTGLRAALDGPGGEALAGRMRGEYDAALIDEFQDTDTVQWSIFQRVFGHKDRRLFLIGDPKQAIYGFRGADIFAYLNAAAATRGERRFTLGRNWRSQRGLVEAVNKLFGGAPKPFVVDQIEFHPVEACGKADEEPLTIGGGRASPLQLWFHARDDDGPVGRTQAQERLSTATASEIARLLDGRARLGRRRLLPEHIAVLVPENHQAQAMQAALAERGVPSVLYTTASLFESREAMEAERVLRAIAQPSDERVLKAALATDLLGLRGDELDRLTRQEDEWPATLARFHQYLELWIGQGFIQMFRRLLQRERVRARLLSFPDGDRRLTNVLHLADVLHQTASEQRLSPSRLVRWLGEQRLEPAQGSDEFQLRLERDENAVKLVTIHRSKGLEYPVVFAPFCWRNAEIARRGGKEEEVLFHDRADHNRLTRDLGSPGLEGHRRLAKEERLAENVRLFYVALTRARNRCYFAWGAFRDAATSAPAWLLHQPADLGDDPLGAMTAHFPALNDAAIREALEELARRAGAVGGVPSIAVTPVPDAGSEAYRPPAAPPAVLTPRAFAGVIRRDWRIASFSALTAGQPADLPDRDSIQRPPVEDAPAAGIFAFPRGSKPGACLHELFEHFDFTETEDEVVNRLVAATLAAHGLAEPVFAAAVRDMLRKTVSVRLDPVQPELMLGKVPPAARLNELEFCCPLKRIAPALLRDVFARHRAVDSSGNDAFPERLGRLSFSPASGFMKGFIDLVFEFNDRFYIADWKSNWLGNQVEDYGPAALEREMIEQCYGLQYHLYALALDQYLAHRLPGYEYAQHFGGVYYVFVRGLDPERPEFGIFRDRPTPALMRDLRETLLDWKEVAGA